MESEGDQYPDVTPAEEAVVKATEIRNVILGKVMSVIARVLPGEGPAKSFKVLQAQISKTLASVQQLLASAGIKEAFSFLLQDEQYAIWVKRLDATTAEFSLLEVNLDDTTAELSPEQSAFLTTLKARYEGDEHGIECHTSVEWSRIEAKLKANPAKLDALKRMEDSGGAPDVYRVEGEDFIFGDLSPTAPEGRRNVNYQQAVAGASQMGAGSKLMSPDDYLMIGKKLGIAMDKHPEWVWLDSTISSEDLKDLKALKANFGSRSYNHANVYQRNASNHDDGGAFRCSLRV